MKQSISTKQAPAAIGPYSQAIQAGNCIYVSGQLPIDAAAGTFASDEITGQTKQSLLNIQAILREAGYDMNNIVKTTVYLASMDEFSKMNEVYSQFFTEPYPARAAFQVACLPKNARVEIEAIAVKE
jgi:2-iminobutanoate/2-iminopropanoate deaminase